MVVPGDPDYPVKEAEATPAGEAPPPEPEPAPEPEDSWGEPADDGWINDIF